MVKNLLITPPPPSGMTGYRNRIEDAHDRAFSVATLTVLIDQWENRARSKFKSGEAQPDEASRRFVEHGATCYFNCAQELRAALASALPPSSATPP
jgi:hypothetical protein